jgi:hypothetical protein
LGGSHAKQKKRTTNNPEEIHNKTPLINANDLNAIPATFDPGEGLAENQPLRPKSSDFARARSA